MVDGFAISKDSMDCDGWEAVPTLAGKDPRLAEPEKRKAEPMNHQSHCQRCQRKVAGQPVECMGCPRAYHRECLPIRKGFGGKSLCTQHECADCERKTSGAGGLIYRCRDCEKGYCEDCLQWEKVQLLGETLPELEKLGLGAKVQAWYIICQGCLLRER